MEDSGLEKRVIELERRLLLVEERWKCFDEARFELAEKLMAAKAPAPEQES